MSFLRAPTGFGSSTNSVIPCSVRSFSRASVSTVRLWRIRCCVAKYIRTWLLKGWEPTSETWSTASTVGARTLISITAALEYSFCIRAVSTATRAQSSTVKPSTR